MEQSLLGGRIEPVDIQDEIQRSYLDYAMSVIVGRALPDIRDGLKPVQRRILWSMLESGLRPDRPFRKSVATVGEVLKKYHPHGDQSVYDALVRMAQPWNLRAPLVQGQGNFGSSEGDPAAAYRYCVTGDSLVRMADGTSVRLAELAPRARPDSDTVIDAKLAGRVGSPVRATRLFHSGEHPTLRVRTREGYEVTGTRNHPILCLVPVAGVPMLLWKLLSEVVPGDRVALLRRPADEREVLREADEHLAVLSGGWISEGWASATRAGFNNVDPEYFARVLEAYDSVVGGRRYVYRRRIRSGSTLHEIDVQNMAAFEAGPLRELVGGRSKDKRVPSFVWSRGPAFKALFLRALYEGDGSSVLMPRGAIQVCYSTRSRGLAADVQQLLLELGVVSRLASYPTGEFKVLVTNRRDARRFARDVGFLGRKQERLLRQLERVPTRSRAMSSDHVPFIAAYVRSSRIGAWSDRDWLRRHNFDRVERWEREGAAILSHLTNGEVRRVVEPLVDGTYYFAEVATVADAGVRPVYSVRVESDDHAFITNGYVSHNTEARLSPLAMEILSDIDADTVDFEPNFDGHEMQPVVLPARFPNLLVNGAGGIAVGMATNIPPHNLGEVIDGTIAYLERPEVTLAELIKLIKGPDFPTGATILGKESIRQVYETGRGSIRMRAVSQVEESSQGRQRIVVTEVPYQVNPSTLLQKIAVLRKEGRIRDIAADTATRQAIRNESRADLRLVIELRPGANPHVVLNQLYKHTQLQESFGVIMLTIVEGVPRVLDLKEIVRHYVEHQVDVVTRRTRFLLRKAEERDHIVLGLLIALDHLDEVIKIIRGSQHADEARTKLMKRFKLSEVQANHILDMPLRRLTRLARAELEGEHAELLERIGYFQALLGDPAKIRGVIKDELLEVKRRFADRRRTQIKADEAELDLEDLIAEEDVVVTVSRAGYVKRLPVDTYRRQGRGGKGVRGANLKAEDVVSHVFTTTTHHWILVFTTKGRVYRVKVHEIPEGSRTSRGLFAANLPGVVVDADERIAAVMDLKDYDPRRYLVFATKRGIVKKTALPEYDSPRTGLIAINLRDGDELIDVMLTDGKDDILLVSRKGQAIRFSERAVRPMGRPAAGVIGMRLAEDDEVITLCRATDGEELISVTRGGFGKRTPMKAFPRKGRGGKGVIAAKLTSRTGLLAGAHAGAKDEDLFVFASTGDIIRVPVATIRRVGRPSQGVRTMRIGDGGEVVAISPVVTQGEEE